MHALRKSWKAKNYYRARLLLAAGALLSTPGPAFGQSTSAGLASPKWEAASVRLCAPDPAIAGRRSSSMGVSPQRLHVSCVSLEFLIGAAYVELADSQHSPLAGGPAWIKSDLYDIEAKAEGDPTAQQMKGPMLQALLEDRFKLKVHRESKDEPVYNLTAAKNGFKLQALKEGSCSDYDPLNPVPHDRLCMGWSLGPTGPGKPYVADVRGRTIELSCQELSQFMDRVVLNKTNIQGKFDLHFEFAPDQTTPALLPGGAFALPTGAPLEASVPGPSIFTAIQEQTGLKLEPAKGPRDVLVIDSVERPSEN
jgi:uncharacterized protein (TIGR03435 family)